MMSLVTNFRRGRRIKLVDSPNWYAQPSVRVRAPERKACKRKRRKAAESESVRQLYRTLRSNTLQLHSTGKNKILYRTTHRIIQYPSLTGTSLLRDSLNSHRQVLLLFPQTPILFRTIWTTFVNLHCYSNKLTDQGCHLIGYADDILANIIYCDTMKD